MKIKCPNCKVDTTYSKDNEFRPFCSDRCRLIDLGDWAEGKHIVVDNEGASVAEGIDRKKKAEID